MEQYIAVGIIVAASVAYMLKKLVFKPKNTNAACNVRDDGISILMGLDSQATVAGKPVAPAGSKRKTRPSVEDRALVPNGSCDEPQTTRHAAA